ncbi:MAG: 4-hydroxy-tetrahydrodipicolinate reductase, partial [Acidimicrobiia bacterium]|nr:4-hydroxy-tetrahydrodipicolinate reductase [Acidimicrobiia bacterium]
MGATVCEMVVSDRELELVAAVDPHHSGLDLRQACGVDVPGLMVRPNTDGLEETGVEVMVDFTVLQAAKQNLAWCAANGVHAVVGTTGFDADDYAELEKRFSKSNCFIAPNFASGAVLMMRFAELAAPYFETGEIIELHHNQKVV